MAIYKIPTPINIKGIRTKRYDASKYAIIKLFILNKDALYIGVIKRKLYLVDDLTANALIGINIISPKGIIINLTVNIITINAYGNFTIPIITSIKGIKTSASIFSTY